MTEPAEHEVVVLGGGPAGCAAATLLARRSHDVALVHPRLPPAGALAESIPPSARKLLEELGLLEALVGAGLHPNTGNTVWWADRDPRSETFPTGEHGVHTDRAGLERVLSEAAAAVGVTVYAETTARAAEEADTGWRIRCETAQGAELRLAAPWLLDATGRHGLVARREGRQPDRSTTTIALVGRWRREGGWPAEWAGHTLVESYADGWAWSVPLDARTRCVTAMVDQREATLEGGDVRVMLLAELAKTRHVGGLLEGAEALGEGWACPASLYSASRFARPGLLLLGDAASFIDPLSSYGVKKALSSGWLAGIAAHTALIEPAMADTVVRYFDAREREVYRRYRRISATFFEEAAEAYGHPYWIRRAEAAREAGGGPAPEPAGDPDALDGAGVPEERVRAAFEVIRARETLDARPGPTLAWLERPAVVGQRIVLAPHLVSEDVPEGIRWVRGVDLRALVEVAPRHDQVPDGWAAYNGVASPVTLPDYLTALSTAFAAGFLTHRDG